jgi:hypothetical protein
VELGHDVVNPLFEECPGSGKVCRCWWHRKLGYGSHEEGRKRVTKKRGGGGRNKRGPAGTMRGV